MSEIKNVVVVGGGFMGSGIAQASFVYSVQLEATIRCCLREQKKSRANRKQLILYARALQLFLIIFLSI